MKENKQKQQRRNRRNKSRPKSRSLNNDNNVRYTLWDKIERLLDKERVMFKINKKHLTNELIISCMHIITGSIKELNAHQDQNEQDRIIETFIEAFHQELINNQDLKSRQRIWLYVTSSIIINTTDQKYLESIIEKRSI